MRIVEAPEKYRPEKGVFPVLPNSKTVFLAGGITNCWNWQNDALYLFSQSKLSDDYVIFNPRREDFPIDDPNAAEEQITWEHNALRFCQVIMFWFPHETLCPIVLYELGAWSMTGKPIYVGAHHEYQRLQDVKIQTKLARPEVKIIMSLDGLVDAVLHHEWR